MEVDQARAFLVLAEELHFGRAAERLRMAQPPLSRMIKQLERSLGAELFLRSTRHVELTVPGNALLEPARRLIQASEAAQQIVHETISGERGQIRIGFAGASVHKSVGEIARQFRRRIPRVDLELHSSQFSHAGLMKILAGDLDLAIGRWDFLPTEISSFVVGRETMLVAVSENHPMASRTSVTMTELSEEKWITLPGGFGAALQNRLNALAMYAGFVPRVAQQAPDSWTLVVLVGAEIGIALTLDSIRDNINPDNVVFLPLSESEDQLDVQMIWHRANNNPALHLAIDAARTVFSD